jgi:hypothetical protein
MSSMKQPDSANSIPPHVLAVLMAILSVGLFAIGAMLFYCAVHPFGASPPPQDVCWIVGSILIALGVASAFGSYHYGRAGSVRSRSGSQASAATTATLSVGGIDAKSPANNVQQGIKFSMRDALLSQPALQQSMGNLVEALIQAAPEHYAMIHLLVEARKADGKTAILFTHGSPVLLNEYSTLVSDGIANAAFQVIDLLLRQDDSIPGIEVVLRKTGAQKWDADARRLDELDSQWPTFPRYPLRVCGYGLSLAPPPDTTFRWSRHPNPPAIVAAARKAPNAPFKYVQVTLADPGPRIALRDGVAKAEEVIQISEGPATNQWVIQTPIFHAIWPAGLDLRSPLASKTRFDLVGADDTLLFVQGPVAGERLLDAMAADGQAEIARGQTLAGHEWIELAYETGGAQWRQRHHMRMISPSRSFVVTAQCLRPVAEQVFQSSGEFTDSLNEPAK